MLKRKNHFTARKVAIIFSRMPKRKLSMAMGSEPKKRTTRSRILKSSREPDRAVLQDTAPPPVQPEEASPPERSQEIPTDTVFTIDTERIQESVTAAVISAITEQVGQAVQTELARAFPAAMLKASREAQPKDDSQTPATATKGSTTTWFHSTQNPTAQTAAATATASGPGLGPDPATSRPSPGEASSIRQGLMPDVSLGFGSLTSLPGIGESLGIGGSVLCSLICALAFRFRSESRSQRKDLGK